ncbi:Alpha-L-Rha alpha-1,3-L-rhamnosyltransferase [Altererythrobacter epoxidivorans]|uniref:Alpha-L-Rha alpha-1,3-L-rhamnosyltransferase n=1 Tax=Altererythrobacter epoxidivorans TaxID=361183 RepID=A0A0M4LSH0_9SPHN|nr:glycosyltransferase [Altererythrobacter epoxidivorans]ALE15491.1 Alpha-L-Rha alpha-1,3-L-rhamnosyltransferase [Altererythrobacter epoxidivorans]
MGFDSVRAGAVAVVMAVYRPDLSSLERQVETILAQSDVDVRLIAMLDGPGAEVPGLDAILSLDQRIETVRSASQRGAAETFVTGLEHALAGSWVGQNRAAIAFADQDDVWHPEKLAATLGAMRAEQSSAAHCDLRVVDENGRLIAESIFDYEKRVRHPSLIARFFRNNVTGLVMVMDQETAAAVVRFARYRPSAWYHDHFAAFLAAVRHGIAFHDAVLADYVQHGGNLVGAQGQRSRADRLLQLKDHNREAESWLDEGGLLVDALLDSDWPTESGRSHLAKLQNLLRKTGPSGLWAAMAALPETRLSNPVAALNFRRKLYSVFG